MQALQDMVQSYQREVDEVSDEAQALTKVSSEARVTTYVSQLTDRYDTLMNSVKVSNWVDVNSGLFDLKHFI